MVTPSKEFKLPFLKKEERGKDTLSFFFDATKINLDFKAGQYINMFLNCKKNDNLENIRSFTISSPPEQKDILMITVKVIPKPSLFKQKLLSLTQGELVDFTGPFGSFVLPERTERPQVFLAGGMGITPFYSMLLHARAINYTMPITLFTSFNTIEEAIFQKELLQIAKEMPTIKVIYTVTNLQGVSNDWVCETGRISEELLNKYIDSIKDPDYFICGPTPMVAAMLDLLQDLKVPPQQVREEQFSGY